MLWLCCCRQVGLCYGYVVVDRDMAPRVYLDASSVHGTAVS